MANIVAVPVDHQPDFGERWAGIPVDHDPFAEPTAQDMASGGQYALMASRLRDMAADKNKPADLSLIERGLLKVMDLADRAGNDSTSLRMYNDIIQRGRTSTITENDFTPSEQAALRSLVLNKAESAGPTGHVDYRDYPGGNMRLASGRTKESGEILNTLGGFDYALKPDGTVNVSDKYDFNADRGDSLDNNLLAQGFSAIFDPRSLAASIGRKVLPDTSGRGVPVSITLPPS